MSCGFFTEFKVEECPKEISTKYAPINLPPLICAEKGTKHHKNEINVEVKKGVCGRTTFLKPYKYGEKLPEKKKSCEFHTLAFKIKPLVGTQRRSFHTSPCLQLLKNIKENRGDGQHIETDMDMPLNHHRDSFSPSKSGAG